MRVVLVGARDRSSLKDRFRSSDLSDGSVTDDMRNVVQRIDRDIITRAVSRLQEKFRGNLTLVSVGCDDGVGYLVKEICSRENIWFAEVSIHFNGERRPKPEYTKFYLSRNATVVEIGDLFIMLPSNNKQSVIEDILDRVKRMEVPYPYVVFDENGDVSDKNTDMLEGM